MLAPVNFDAMYRQAVAQQAAQGDEAALTEQAAPSEEDGATL